MPTRANIVSADVVPRWNGYAAMTRDWNRSGPARGNGILTQEALRLSIAADMSADRVSRDGDSGALKRAEQSRSLLKYMEKNDVDGLSYLPAELERLPKNLKARATELLMMDDHHFEGSLTQNVLEAGRIRWEDAEVRTASLVRQQQTALTEIDELAARLGLH